MSTGSVLMLVAAIVSAEGGVTRIDQGSIQGLEPGDRGQVFYELTVNGLPKRIEAGSAVVLEVAASSSSVQATPGTNLRPGYQIEIQIPTSRTNEPPPIEPAELVPPIEPAEPGQPIEAAGPVPAEGLSFEPVPTGERSSEPELPIEAAGPVPAEARPSEPMPTGDHLSEPVPPTTILIPAGRYSVGRDVPSAEFFNQTPRFEVETGALQIDRRPVTVEQYSTAGHLSAGASNPTDHVRAITWSEAEAYCRSVGARLPTELEWEIAVQIPDVESPSGLLEWTASWYQPYPGNAHPEEQYGETYRVLRGAPSGAAFDPYARRFMAPEQRNSSVGFRCTIPEGPG